MTKPQAATADPDNVNPFTGCPTNTAGELTMIVHDNCQPLYCFLQLLQLHQTWVDNGRVGQQPVAFVRPMFAQSTGRRMNNAAADMLMRERVTWNKNRGEIWVKTRPPVWGK